MYFNSTIKTQRSFVNGIFATQLQLSCVDFYQQFEVFFCIDSSAEKVYLICDAGRTLFRNQISNLRALNRSSVEMKSELVQVGAQ